MPDLSGVYVPRDYDDLYRHYILGDGGSLAKVLVRRFTPGETGETREDLVHDVYLRMVTKDVLKLFDPTKSNFGGVVYFVTRTVCVNYLKRKGHDPITNLRKAVLIEASEVEADGQPEKGVLYLDRMDTGDEPEKGMVLLLDAQRKVRGLRNQVDNEAVGRAKQRAVHLHRVMDYLMAGCTPKECAEREGVTISTIYNWLNYLKGLLGEGCETTRL